MIKQGMQDKLELLKSQYSYLDAWSRAEPKKKEGGDKSVSKIESKLIKKGYLKPRLLWTKQTKAIIIENIPISGIFTDLVARYNEDLIKLRNGTYEEVLEIYLQKTLAGSAFNMGVFSMRTAHSRVISQSRMVKDFMRQINSLWPDIKPPENFEIQPDKDLRRYEKLVARALVTRERLSGKV